MNLGVEIDRGASTIALDLSLTFGVSAREQCYVWQPSSPANVRSCLILAVGNVRFPAGLLREATTPSKNHRCRKNALLGTIRRNV